MALLGDVAAVKGGKRLPKGKQVQDLPTEHPYIRVTDFAPHGVKAESVKYIDDEAFSKVSRYIISDEDVYISIAGTIGLAGMVPPVLSGANLTENAAKICQIDSSYLPEYICYYLQSKRGQNEIRARIVGTSQPKLALFRIKDIPLPNTGIEKQRDISANIKAYDRLIDNATSRINKLETMGQLVYKKYFQSQDNKNWQKTKFKDVIDLKYGKALVSSDRKDGPYPVYGSSGRVGSHNEQLVDGPGIILGRKGNVGSVYWSESSFYPIDTVFWVESKMPLSFVYFYLKSQRFINNDTAVPGLSRNQANLIDFAIPPGDLVTRFDEFARPLLQLIDNLSRQIEHLSKSRSKLLDYLMKEGANE